MSDAPDAPRYLDVTTQQLADRVAAAISAFTAATAYRLATSSNSPVTDDERAAYDELRAALHDMATEGYDLGYRTAFRLLSKRRPE